MLIVIEGLDRAGKSSLSRNLHARIKAYQAALTVHEYHSPHPKTATFNAITSIIQNGTTMERSPHLFHLLFAASRYEMQPLIENQLKAKEIVIYDRYAYSGKVYSDIDQCGLDVSPSFSASHGLITPDVVFFIDVDPEVSIAREGFGTGLCENVERQHVAAAGFRNLFSNRSLHSCDNIFTLDGSATHEAIANSAFEHLQQSGLTKNYLDEPEKTPQYGIFK